MTHILLINNNPVVSSLLALCTRDEDMLLEEVSDVLTLERDVYDVVFVDEDSCVSQIEECFEMFSANKKVLFLKENANREEFDLIIEKPFLPSQIMEILSTLETEEIVYAPEDKILDSNEIEKIRVLLDMNDELVKEELSEDTYEKRKIEVIKEQLILDGLEIVEEEEIVEELNLNSVDSSASIVSSNHKKVKSKKKKKKISFTADELERIEDAVEVAIATLKRKQMKKLLKGKEIDLSIKLEDI